MADTIPPPAPAPVPSVPPAGIPSIVPPPKDDHPVIRVSKFVAAIVGIAGAISVFVTGIWRVGELLDELEDSQEDLSALREEMTTAQAEDRRRNDIQTEILHNLEIAIAEIRAVSAYRSASTSTTPRARVRTPPPPPSSPTTVPPPPSPPSLPSHDLARPMIMDPPMSGVTTVPGIPSLRRMDPPPPSLPPLPPLPPPTDFSDMPPQPSPSDYDRADVALERAEILRESL